MSVPSIKFIYTGEFRSEVQKMQKGPAKLDCLYDSIINPEYVPISFDHPTLAHPADQIVSKVDINSKNNSTLIRIKSSDTINRERKAEESQGSNSILHIDQPIESEVKIANQRKDSRKQNQHENNQILLKAPTYKFVPHKEGQISVNSQKQFRKNGSIQKCINEEVVIKNRKSKTFLTEQQFVLRNQNPLLKIEQVKEEDFIKKQRFPQSFIRKDVSDDSVVLKAPKYKFRPNVDEKSVNTKKEYSKCENAQRYYFSGIETKQENDFITCFGCNPQAKAYQAKNS